MDLALHGSGAHPEYLDSLLSALESLPEAETAPDGSVVFCPMRPPSPRHLPRPTSRSSPRSPMPPRCTIPHAGPARADARPLGRARGAVHRLHLHRRRHAAGAARTAPPAHLGRAFPAPRRDGARSRGRRRHRHPRDRHAQPRRPALRRRLAAGGRAHAAAAPLRSGRRARRSPRWPRRRLRAAPRHRGPRRRRPVRRDRRGRGGRRRRR